MEAESPYFLRPYKPSDINFIQNSWGSSYYKGAEHIKDYSPIEFNTIHRPIRDELLANPNVTVIIAASHKDEDLILGWILIEKPKTKGIVLHYIYIKQAFKGEGIAEELIKKVLTQAPILVTHMTDRAAKIIKKKKSFDTYFYSPQTIMLRDKYADTLPRYQGEKYGT